MDLGPARQRLTVLIGVMAEVCDHQNGTTRLCLPAWFLRQKTSPAVSVMRAQECLQLHRRGVLLVVLRQRKINVFFVFALTE